VGVPDSGNMWVSQIYTLNFMGVPDIPDIHAGYTGSNCEFKEWRFDGLHTDGITESGLDGRAS